MRLLVFVLNQPERLSELIGCFKECGVTGVTILDSLGVGHDTMLGNSFPSIGAALQNLISRKIAHNKTLFTVVESDEVLRRVIVAIESVLGDLSEGGKGILFVVPLDMVKGFTSSFCDELP